MEDFLVKHGLQCGAAREVHLSCNKNPTKLLLLASRGLMQHAGWHGGPGTQVGMSLGRIIATHMACMQSTHQPASLHAHVLMPDCLNCSRQIQRAIMITFIQAGDLKPLLVAPCKLIESTANPFLTNLRTSLTRSFPTLTHPTYL